MNFRPLAICDVKTHFHCLNRHLGGWGMPCLGSCCRLWRAQVSWEVPVGATSHSLLLPASLCRCLC